jgi:hypothetical protein
MKTSKPKFKIGQFVEVKLSANGWYKAKNKQDLRNHNIQQNKLRRGYILKICNFSKIEKIIPGKYSPYYYITDNPIGGKWGTLEEYLKGGKNKDTESICNNCGMIIITKDGSCIKCNPAEIPNIRFTI